MIEWLFLIHIVMDLSTLHGADLGFRDLNKIDDFPCPQVAPTEIKRANRGYKSISILGRVSRGTKTTEFMINIL